MTSVAALTRYLKKSFQGKIPSPAIARDFGLHKFQFLIKPAKDRDSGRKTRKPETTTKASFGRL
jgi:hypothetical protein